MENLPIPSDGDQDRGWKMIGIYWAMFAIELAVLSLRVYARIKIRAVGLDDWIMGLSVLLTLASLIVGTFLVSAGGYRHVYYVLLDQGLNGISRITKLWLIVQPFVTMAIATGRTSVAILILRIIGKSSIWRRYFLYFSIVSTLVISSLVSILLTVMCSPPKAFWTFEPAKCWDRRVGADLNIVSSSWNVFMDLSLALFPITILWHLNMDAKRKAGICFLMGLGVFAAVAGSIKTAKLPETVQKDFTWVTYDLCLWSGAENLSIVVCGCIPTLKPVYRQLFHHEDKNIGISSARPRPTYRVRSFSSKIPVNDDYTAILTDLNNSSSVKLGAVRHTVIQPDKIHASDDSRTAFCIDHGILGGRNYSSDGPAGRNFDAHDMV